MNDTAVIGMVLSLLVLPGMTFAFIYALRRSKVEVDKLRLQKEILELELKRDELKVLALTEENRKYDAVLAGRITEGH